MYAHVATDPAHPGKLALQYWFFYVYNDWNNLHEGDWEMIQLDFDAATAQRCAREAAGESRLQPARGSGAGDLGRRQAPPGRRHASGRVPGGRLARELLRRGAVPRQLRRAGRRLRQHDRPARRPAPGGRDDPERSGAGSRRVPVDRLPGPLGRAPAGVLQRPDRPEPEDAVDGADHVVGGLARPELHRPGRKRVRDGGDRLLLPGDRQRVEGAGPARPPSAAVHPRRSRRWRCCC